MADLETYLKAMANGETAELPEPTDKLSAYLYEIAKNGGGGGGASPIVFTTMDMQTGTCNKTFEECYADFRNGAMNVCLLIDSSDPILFSFLQTTYNGHNADRQSLQYDLAMNGTYLGVTYYSTGVIEVSMGEA